ncbi:conserved hypothetical protein [Burkholderiales bacterium 8X]|nr:conserved hypothetical protein [Burkholderiales bacterium 8X]
MTRSGSPAWPGIKPGALCAWLGLLLAWPLAGSAQPAARAHVHGQVKLEVVIDGPTVVIEMSSPLDNFVGFEHAPRSDSERQRVDDVLARLRLPDEMFKIDPVGNCKLGPVSLRSAALGLGKGEGASAEAHADLDGTFAFNCTNATATKFIDLGFFNAFRSVRQIDAQIASPQGQFQRTLKKPNARLAWSK